MLFFNGKDVIRTTSEPILMIEKKDKKNWRNVINESCKSKTEGFWEIQLLFTNTRKLLSRIFSIFR